MSFPAIASYTTASDLNDLTYNVDLAMPSGLAANDWIAIFVSYNQSAPTIWDGGFPGGTQLGSHNQFDESFQIAGVRHGLWGKRANGTESWPFSVHSTSGGSEYLTCACLRITGGDPPTGIEPPYTMYFTHRDSPSASQHTTSPIDTRASQEFDVLLLTFVSAITSAAFSAVNATEVLEYSNQDDTTRKIAIYTQQFSLPGVIGSAIDVSAPAAVGISAAAVESPTIPHWGIDGTAHN